MTNETNNADSLESVQQPEISPVVDQAIDGLNVVKDLASTVKGLVDQAKENGEQEVAVVQGKLDEAQQKVEEMTEALSQVQEELAGYKRAMEVIALFSQTLKDTGDVNQAANVANSPVQSTAN